MSRNQLVLHCGGQPASLAEVTAVPIPDATATYHPVPHAALVELLKDRVERETRMPLLSEQYGLNREGRQLFGVLQYELPGDDQTSVAFGLRNSYDKTMSVGFVRGLNVFVCDNLAFHGSAVQIVRKHTPKVWQDVKTAVILSTIETEARVAEQRRWLAGLRELPCTLDQGYGVLGKSVGRNMLTVTQFSAAMDEWRAIHVVPNYRHSEWKDTAYGLYQAMTEGTKRGSVQYKIEEYCNATNLISEEFGLVV